MSDLVDKLDKLKTGLQQKDPAVCGTAPDWLIETILRNLEKAIDQTANSGMEEINRFALGAIRYVADQAGNCDVLLERLNDLLACTE